jgi:hypothetical protein
MKTAFRPISDKNEIVGINTKRDYVQIRLTIFHNY